MYDDCKVYGPYPRKDGRSVVILRRDKCNKTVSYPKYLVEKSIGRLLHEDETVHHKDGDIDNNDMSNLVAIKRSEHAFGHALMYPEQFKTKCVWCGMPSGRSW